MAKIPNYSTWPYSWVAAYLWGCLSADGIVTASSLQMNFSSIRKRDYIAGMMKQIGASDIDAPEEPNKHGNFYSHLYHVRCNTPKPGEPLYDGTPMYGQGFRLYNTVPEQVMTGDINVRTIFLTGTIEGEGDSHDYEVNGVIIPGGSGRVWKDARDEIYYDGYFTSGELLCRKIALLYASVFSTDDATGEFGEDLGIDQVYNERLYAYRLPAGRWSVRVPAWTFDGSRWPNMFWNQNIGRPPFFPFFAYGRCPGGYVK